METLFDPEHVETVRVFRDRGWMESWSRYLFSYDSPLNPLIHFHPTYYLLKSRQEGCEENSVDAFGDEWRGLVLRFP